MPASRALSQLPSKICWEPVRDSSIVVYRSTDNGLTFNSVSLVNQGFGTNIYNDKPWIAIDSSNGSPYVGISYVAFTRYYSNFVRSGTLFQRSLDQGLTWQTPVLLSTQVPGIAVFGSSVAIGPVGEVYASWIQYSPGTPRFVIRRSDDAGQTFGPEVTVSTISLVTNPLPFPPNFSFRVLTSSFLAVDISPNLAEGIVYAVWQDNRSGSSHILLSRSVDRGTTWSSPIQVDDSPAGTQNFFPNVAVSRITGKVTVMYYTNRVNSSMLDVYAADSNDAGASFLPSRRVTDASFDPNADPTLGVPTPSIGDYNDLTLLNNGVPLIYWMDTRTGSQQIFEGN